MSVRFVVRLMFEWGGGCLWCMNEAAREQFDVGPIEDRLPLSHATRQRLIELTKWHDTSLNWAYPPDPGPWTKDEHERFDRAAKEILVQIRAELGHEYDVEYGPT